MKEIKFRAWDVEEKRMLSWSELITNDGGPFDPSWPPIVSVLAPVDEISYIPLQFTGLHDKNGKEIYEGDIVAALNGAIEGIVVYQAPSFVIKQSPRARRWSNFNLAPHEKQYQKVIGNIQENPELLQ